MRQGSHLSHPMVDAVRDPRDDLPCPWARIDAAGRVEAGNLALAGLLACEREAIVGSTFDAWLSPASRVLYQSLVQPLLKLHGHVSELALSVRSPSGAHQDVLFYAAHQGDGRVSVQLVVIRQRRRIENELLRVKRAADQAPGMVFQLERVDADRWRFPYVSEAVRQLYGATTEDALRSAEAIFAQWWPQDRQAVLEALERAAAADTPFRVLVRLGSAASIAGVDPAQRWHEIQGKARSRSDGGMLWHGYLTDVTERMAMQDAVIQRHALERLARTRSEFIARVSHELRTPLNGIMGFAQLLARDVDGPLNSSQRERLGVIIDAGQHLLGVVNQLLEISRIETGQLELAVQAVDLRPLLAQVAHLMGATARDQGVCLRVTPSSHPSVALAEPQRLRQVLLNLLSNAVKYNRLGGQVTVSTWGTDREIGVDIMDTGAGLSESQIAELFQPFNRLGAERTAIEGAGLGLVVSRHLIELMGGRITVRSEVGAGSSFGIVLPAATATVALPPGPDTLDQAPRRAIASGDHAAGAVRGAVLYVEDNPVNAMLMEALLSQRPEVTLHVCVDGRDALQHVQHSTPSLLLIDMHLPDGTGIELLRRLRQVPSLGRVPAIVVSASAGPDAEALARDAGFDGYWTKPLDLAWTLNELDFYLAPASPEMPRLTPRHRDDVNDNAEP